MTFNPSRKPGQQGSDILALSQEVQEVDDRVVILSQEVQEVDDRVTTLEESPSGTVPQLHDLTNDPIASWQFQGEEVSPGDPLTLALLDTAGDAGGPYNLTLGGSGTLRLGTGHAPQLQGWANVDERLENTNTDLLLLAAASFVGVITPATVANMWIIGWSGSGESEAQNVAYEFRIENGGLFYGHENGAGDNNNTFFTSTGIIVGVPQHVAFTRAANGVDIKVFIQGVKVGEVTAANAPTGGGAQRLLVGEGPGGIVPLIGGMTSFQLFDTELTEVQVLEKAKRAMGF